jgi:hypothetical protein
MKYLNICSKRTINKDAVPKTIFHKVGVVKITENGGWFIQLYQQPDVDFQIFPSQDESLPTIEA